MISNRQLSHAQVPSLATKFPISILANDINIAGNVGSLFRVADALGVEKLYLTGSTATPPKYKIRKAARSSDKHINYEYQESASELIKTLKEQNSTIVCLEITDSSINIRDFKPTLTNKICLVIGSENEGISPELLSLADETVHIPMYGENSSMNVATSCAIALHELIQHFQR